MRSLVTENPMLIEVSRFKRRMLETGRGRAVSMIVLSIVVLAYMSLLLVIARFAGDIDPVGVIFVQTAIFAVIGPAITYGAIAGERDRRSWDLLLAAPITNGQIVMGKFLAALAGIACAWVAFLAPTLLAAVTYTPGVRQAGRNVWEVVGALAAQEAVSISFGVLVVALTLFFSARSRRSFPALAFTVGTLFVWLLAVPAVVSLAPVFPGADIALFGHPFSAIARLDSEVVQMPSEPLIVPSLPDAFFGFPQAFFFLLAAIGFVLWAKQSLTMVDRDGGGAPVA